MRTKFLQISIFVLIGMITACASSSNKPNDLSSNAKEQQIIGEIPTGSAFSKLKIGMSSKQAHDLIGEPTDTVNQMTGKMFIPFYFGNDVMRLEELYKGQGRITYTGVGVGGVNYNIYRIVYDPNEDGYNNK
jgi:hypothetical protein